MIKVIRPFGPTIAKVKMSKDLIDELNSHLDEIVSDEEKSKKQEHALKNKSKNWPRPKKHVFSKKTCFFGRGQFCHLFLRTCSSFFGFSGSVPVGKMASKAWQNILASGRPNQSNPTSQRTPRRPTSPRPRPRWADGARRYPWSHGVKGEICQSGLSGP